MTAIQARAPALSDLYRPIAAALESSDRIFREELASDQPFLRDLCDHVARFHGKRLRPALLLLVADACGGLRSEHEVLAAVVEMVHIATLVHDDVLDEADVRRKAPTVNRLCGNEQAVLVGDYLISHSFHLCASLQSQSASRIIAATSNTVCEGEMMQVANRDNLDLTERQYYDIIGRKTASLTAACCLLGAEFAVRDEALVERMREFGWSLGIAFQITDDLLDITGDEDEAGKSLGRDVHKGKLTLPLMHFLQTAPREQRSAAIELLRGDRADRHLRIAAMLSESASIDYAREAAESNIRRAVEILQALPASASRESLTTMAEFVLARRQ
ncbi:MAG: polyprenyl synthetase family protein [Phycisphaerales bacterium]|nr:polyprenyl synthetase family protein [Phycisphaerales bacterium]